MNDTTTKPYKIRLIDAIDEYDQAGTLTQHVHEYARLDHDYDSLIDHIIDMRDEIKSDHFDIDCIEDLERGLDNWEPTAEVYTHYIEQAVAEVGIQKCFDWWIEYFHQSPHSLNDLYSAVIEDIKNAVHAGFMDIAREMEDEEVQ